MLKIVYLQSYYSKEILTNFKTFKILNYNNFYLWSFKKYKKTISSETKYQNTYSIQVSIFRRQLCILAHFIFC